MKRKGVMDSFVSIKKQAISSPSSSDNCSFVDVLKVKGFLVEHIAPGSWIAYKPGLFPSSTEQFETVWNQHPQELKTIKLFGKDQVVPRYQQAYGRSYMYSGIVSDCVENSPVIDHFEKSLNEMFKQAQDFPALNMCLCNWYEPHHYIGPHSDDTRQFHPLSPVCTISWGATRTFVMTPKSKDRGHKTRKLLLNDGDVVIMGGKCQETHKHEILKKRASEVIGRRINFSFRSFK